MQNELHLHAFTASTSHKGQKALMCLAASPALGTTLGLRYESMFTYFSDNIGRDLQEDVEVKTWVKGLMNDPIVKIVKGTVDETRFLTKTAVALTTSVAKFVALPITYPLSYITGQEKFKLTPCPFKPATVVENNTNGELIEAYQNSYEKLILRIKNMMNEASLSTNPLIKVPYTIADFVQKIGVKALSRFTEPSQEQLVVSGIQMYYPDFNVAEFESWLEKSFIPVFIERYLRANISLLTGMCSQAVLKDRQAKVADLIEQRILIRSKLLHIHDVEVVEFSFHNKLPVVVVKLLADHTDEMRTMTNKIVSGGPQNIMKTAFMVSVTIENSKDTPKWIVSEVFVGSTKPRI